MKLTELPDINFVNTDTEKIKAELINAGEKYLGRTLADGDPVRLFLEAIAYQFVIERNHINYTAKQNLLAYASGAFLDHLGILVGVTRILPKRAATTVRFKLSTKRNSLTIPKGTRVSAGDDVFFAAGRDWVVKSGEMKIDIPMFCTEDGDRGNNYLPGQLNRLVDPIPYIDSVESLTTSEGGADLEDDENLRLRIQKAPESFSCAGPQGAYEYFAKMSHQDIESVSVVSPKPGEVEIRPLMKGGGIPEQEVIALVKKACNDKRVRPLTDKVTVIAPTKVTFDVAVKYWIDQSKVSTESETKKRIEAAVKEYELWQRSALGRDINPSELIARMVRAGAKRVEVTKPVFTKVPPTSVAVCNTSQATYGGMEDE